MNRDKMAMRYAARMVCIYDWMYGTMDRTPEDLGKERCIEGITRISSFDDERVQNLCKEATAGLEGIGVQDVAKAGKWILPEVVRVYDMQRREILASERLAEIYARDGRTLKDISDAFHVYGWEFLGWTNFHNRIQWLVVLAIESLEEQGGKYTLEDIFKERDRLRQELGRK